MALKSPRSSGTFSAAVHSVMPMVIPTESITLCGVGFVLLLICFSLFEQSSNYRLMRTYAMGLLHGLLLAVAFKLSGRARSEKGTIPTPATAKSKPRERTSARKASSTPKTKPPRQPEPPPEPEQSELPQAHLVMSVDEFENLRQSLPGKSPAPRPAPRQIRRRQSPRKSLPPAHLSMYSM